jgi:hypothetical protein
VTVLEEMGLQVDPVIKELNVIEWNMYKVSKERKAMGLIPNSV